MKGSVPLPIYLKLGLWVAGMHFSGWLNAAFGN